MILVCTSYTPFGISNMYFVARALGVQLYCVCIVLNLVLPLYTVPLGCVLECDNSYHRGQRRRVPVEQSRSASVWSSNRFVLQL